MPRGALRGDAPTLKHFSEYAKLMLLEGKANDGDLELRPEIKKLVDMQLFDEDKATTLLGLARLVPKSAHHDASLLFGLEKLLPKLAGIALNIANVMPAPPKSEDEQERWTSMYKDFGGDLVTVSKETAGLRRKHLADTHEMGQLSCTEVADSVAILGGLVVLWTYQGAADLMKDTKDLVPERVEETLRSRNLSLIGKRCFTEKHDTASSNITVLSGIDGCLQTIVTGLDAVELPLNAREAFKEFNLSVASLRIYNVSVYAASLVATEFPGKSKASRAATMREYQLSRSHNSLWLILFSVSTCLFVLRRNVTPCHVRCSEMGDGMMSVILSFRSLHAFRIPLGCIVM